MAAEEERGGVADKAAQLLLEMKRNPDILPPFNKDLVRYCLSKVDELYKRNANIVAEMRNVKHIEASCLQPRIMGMYHIRRCLIAYINARKERIRSYRWKYGGVLPENIRNALSEAEQEYFQEYSSAVAGFQVGCGEFGVNLLNNSEPPKKLFVQVRGLKDYGEFETMDGSLVVIRVDSLHSLLLQECEGLIRQGVLEITD